ncbi:unnamed protein product, partial [Symbiodinium natans]
MPDAGTSTYGVGHCYDHISAANSGTVPDPPPLLFGSFTDADPDAGQVGGTLTWTVDGTYNIGFDYTSHYALYLSLDTGGTSRFEIARVQPGLLSSLATVLQSVDALTRGTGMYGINSHGEAATPSFGHCFEAADGTSTTTTAPWMTKSAVHAQAGHVNTSAAAITSVAFTDTSTGYGYWIDGTVTWVAPNNPAFEYFRIVMSATSTGADGAIMVDNLDKSLRTYEIVNLDSRGIVRG